MDDRHFRRKIRFETMSETRFTDDELLGKQKCFLVEQSHLLEIFPSEHQARPAPRINRKRPSQISVEHVVLPVSGEPGFVPERGVVEKEQVAEGRPCPCAGQFPGSVGSPGVSGNDRAVGKLIEKPDGDGEDVLLDKGVVVEQHDRVEILGEGFFDSEVIACRKPPVFIG